MGEAMDSPFYCLMVAGQPLSTPVRRILFRTAREMARSGQTRKHVRADDVEGVVSTAFRHESFAAISGIAFSAEIETSQGKTTAKYIVRVADLDADEEGEWSPWVNMYEEERRRARAQFN